MIRALVLKRLIIGAITETQTRTYHEYVIDEKGETVKVRKTLTQPVEVPFYAEPGDVIDVDGWAHLSAYVSSGKIQLVPDSDAEVVSAPPRDAVPTEAPEEAPEDPEAAATAEGDEEAAEGVSEGVSAEAPEQYDWTGLKVQEILDFVGDDKALAAQALEFEEAQKKSRTSLKTKLAAIINTEESA